MACAYPFVLSHLYKGSRGQVWEFSDYTVPCGWCLNCRQDKINYYTDRCKYELCNRLTGAFVTFTYDDIHLLSHCLPNVCEIDLPNSIKNEEFSLNYRDFTKFIDNLRHYINNHSEIQGVLCQPDFSYMYCGEYGDSFGRPHIHCLFFGLDFAYCRKFIMECWKFGLIDVLPILDGAIGYVCKYLSKQLFGALAYDTYDVKGLARPRIRFSKSFGKGLLLNNLKDIVKNNYTYSVGSGLRRPISAYWKKLITGNSFMRDKTDKLKIKNNIIKKMKSYHLKDFSKHKMSEFKVRLARIREENLKNKLRMNGVSVPEITQLYKHKFISMKYIYSEVKKLSLDNQSLLQRDYINKLLTEVA